MEHVRNVTTVGEFKLNSIFMQIVGAFHHFVGNFNPSFSSIVGNFDLDIFSTRVPVEPSDTGIDIDFRRFSAIFCDPDGACGDFSFLPGAVE